MTTSRYLVILDEFGMPTDILERKQDILEYLNKEDDTETIKRTFEDDSGEV